jgi:hypothetical protein
MRGPTPPIGASSGALTWTHTRGITRTSPTYRVRSEENMWHHTYITSDIPLHRGKLQAPAAPYMPPPPPLPVDASSESAMSHYETIA